MNILKEQGKAILLGNEAIARGALEAGVQFASTYPGTPASEIGDTFSKIQSSENRIDNFYFEYSTNEKTALEAAIGASYCGLKSLVSMKHFGLNVCSDSLMPFVYTGCKGPTVIVVGDDPCCWSSGQSEQNTRAFANLAHIPIWEPSDPSEAKQFVKRAFATSAKFKVPVMVRITTRVAHQRQIVPLEEIDIPESQGLFEKDFKQYVTMPPRVLEMKQELLEKIDKIQQAAEKDDLNFTLFSQEQSDLAIITSGVSYLYVRQALEELGVKVPVLKLGYFYPLPQKKIKSFISGLKEVLVVEELEPYLEEKTKILAKDANPELEVLGKEILTKAKQKFSKPLPAVVEELRPEYVTAALAEITGSSYEIPAQPSVKAIKHIPRFCTGSGCPYWKLFAAVKNAINQVKEKSKPGLPSKLVIGGDIGCYMMAGFPHTQLQDYLLNMGSSVGIAHGIEKALEQSDNPHQKVIAFIGDSTFFHAGIPALINSVYNGSDPLIIVADNRITAMTGLQPNPGMERTGMGEQAPLIRIEDIARSCGVKNVKVIDEEKEFKELVETVKSFLEKKEVSVIVAKHICWLLSKQKS